jgi:O-methyltransferase domain
MCVLRDWDDEAACAILRRCTQAVGPNRRAFVVEKLVTDTDHRTEMDLRVLAYFGGRERDLTELAALAPAAGLRAPAVHPAGATPVLELTAL